MLDGTMLIDQGGGAAWYGGNNDKQVLDRWTIMTFGAFFSDQCK